MTKDTLLFRQINPVWVQNGRITSQAFKPTPKDNKRLSVYDGDKITASEAWNHYVCVLGFTSAGVVAVTVEECQSRDLNVEPDPIPFPAHAVILFTEFSVSQIEKVAKYLKKAAIQRGWQYQAEKDDDPC